MDLALTEAPVALSRLVDRQWVMQPVGALMRSTIESAFIAEGLAVPRPMLITNSLVVLLAAISRSDAVAPVPAEVAERVAGDGRLHPGIVALDLRARIEVEPCALISAPDRRVSPTAGQVYDARLAAARRG